MIIKTLLLKYHGLLNLKATFPVWPLNWLVFICSVERRYLGILDLQSAATGVDVCAVERCLGTLCTLHGVKCKRMVKETPE